MLPFLYNILVTLHIMGAIFGLGGSFAMPKIMKAKRTIAHAEFVHSFFPAVEKSAKIGSLTLAATGLLMGAINPSLFTQIWFITSIVIYIAVQPIVASILPKKAKAQQEILSSHSDKNKPLPEEYITIGKDIAKYDRIMLIAAVVLVLLMTFKPF